MDLRANSALHRRQLRAQACIAGAVGD